MKSPFPGMDPYLETGWGDVKTRLIVYARDQLRHHLPTNLKARIEEITPMRTVGEDSCGMIDFEQPKQRSIQILEGRSDNRMVTTIEILSPANKATEMTAAEFRKKQREKLEGGVNLVEIDLLHAGFYTPPVAADCEPAIDRSPYRICVVRALRPDRAEIYRVPLQQRLPTIRIPLRPTDEDARLDLQAILDQIYENGGNEDIDYHLDPIPPLMGDERNWADAMLRELGLR